MDDLYLSAEIDSRTVCVSPLAKKTYIEAGGKGMGGDYGYFIYEYETLNERAGIEILAKAKSIDAALRLFEMLTSRTLANA